MKIIDPEPWEYALEEQLQSSSAVSTFQPVAVAPRADGWTPERQRRFIEELADCGIVREAAARVGMSEQSAYQLRRRPDAGGFNEAWAAAVQQGVHRLHSTAFERAISGTVRQRYFAGKVVGEETVYDNRLLIYLLGRLDKRRYDEGFNVLRNWHGSMNAIEAGLPVATTSPNEDHNSPVWRGQNGVWYTGFMPPEGFEGDQRGTFGEKGYCRTLSPEEKQALDAWQERRAATARRQRDVYFARLTADTDPPSLAPEV